MTRTGMTMKQLGDQLLVDIGKYKVHPKVCSLVCFIVDATSLVDNDAGFIADLREASSVGLDVRAVIVPVPPASSLQ